MNFALAKAFKSVGFEGVDVEQNSIKSLFIVSEPEAAAEIVLRQHVEIKWTTSADQIHAGGMCGSSFLNENFQDHIFGLLKKHREIGKNDDVLLHRKAEEITWTQFEFTLKRSFDIYDNPRYYHIRTNGLQDDRQHGFANGYVVVPFDDIRQIFLKCFHQIWALVEGQLEACKARGNRADKVVLIGGFSASRSLRAYLKQSLSKYDGGRIQLIAPTINHGTTVSNGAVLRAFNKEHGPQRFARSSYGLLRHLPKDVYDSKHQKRNHQDTNERTQPAPCTGEPYVRITIEWFIKKNDMIPEDWTRKPIRCQHFVKRCEDPQLVVWEALYVSDSATASFFKKSHARNKDCERIGYIRVDMSFLKQEGRLVPKPLPEGVVGDDYYEVEYDLIMKVHDRDLQCRNPP
ncbi:hypothetical protein PG997_011435 [Apiospora hydei]|uniref:Uncharacterized protein n=1 Tax=Apiospora hydei TaxID=1337664 RepID=A0ABR1VJC2_9PEZI